METKIKNIRSISISEHSEYSNSIIIAKYTLTSNYKLHRHTYYELEYVISGQGTESFNGRDTHLSAGALRLISPSDVHELIIKDELVIVKICFDSASISPTVFNSVKQFLGGTAFKVSGTDKDAFDMLFEAAIRIKELFDGSKGFEVTAKPLLESIILTASEYLKQTTVEPEPIKKGEISDVLKYLHTSFDGRLTLNTVAKRFHFTTSYPSRRFHEVVGTTFIKYVKNLRLEYAARLLLTTDAEITEICYESGFSSPSAFANDFKNAYGITASEYRAARNTNQQAVLNETR
jgi:AraC-like DNA-binding protein